MQFLRLMHTELMKLRRSLVVLILAGVPGMVIIMQIAVIATGNAPEDWQRVAMSGAAVWSYLLLPLTATALTALLAQIEHGPKAWSYTLTQPYPKWMVFASKALIAGILMAAVSALLWAAILSGGIIAGEIAPDHALSGALPAGLLAGILSRMWVAGLLVLAIQFAFATGFANFAVPIVVGIAGTFAAVVATSAKAGIYFPWLLATNILAQDPERAQQAFLTGGGTGIALFALTCLWLARRDWL